MLGARDCQRKVEGAGVYGPVEAEGSVVRAKSVGMKVAAYDGH